MSLALYPVLLYWDGDKGLVRFGGRQAKLTAPPHLPGLRITAIDYRPGSIAQVMPYADKWRDMTAGECAAARALILELTSG